MELFYDPEWLAILKNTDFLTQLNDKVVYMPGKLPNSTERTNFFPSVDELDDVFQCFCNDIKVPLNFLHTAPPQTFENENSANSYNNIPPSRYYRLYICAN
jgi:lariat debranching enzyme